MDSCANAEAEEGTTDTEAWGIIVDAEVEGEGENVYEVEGEEKDNGASIVTVGDVDIEPNFCRKQILIWKLNFIEYHNL